MKKIIILLLIGLSLLACKPKGKIYTIEELKKDKDLLYKVSKECISMSKLDYSNSENCARAETAVTYFRTINGGFGGGFGGSGELSPFVNVYEDNKERIYIK